MTKLELLIKLRSLSASADTYLESVPQDLKEALFANPYANTRGLMYDALIDYVFWDDADIVHSFLQDGGVTVLDRSSGLSVTVNTPEELAEELNRP